MSLRGIYGGTFDPIHFGHLRTAWEVSLAANMPVHMVVAGQPPHRATPGVEAEDRWAMLKIALEGQSRLIPDDRELRREGPSYMIDTVDSFRGEFDDSICLILGQDAANHLDSWHRWEELLERVHLIIMTRPGNAAGFAGDMSGPSPALSGLLDQREVAEVEELRRAENPSLWRCRVSALEISATRIRGALAAGEEPRFLLPEPVLRYVHENGLYAPESGI